ncbi:MAG TPA: ABC transporter permease, partial [Vicinamibacterales bacterium]
TESVLLAALGGIVGVTIANACLTVIVVLIPPYLLPSEAAIGLNWPALVFSLAASCATALIFGLVPALHTTRHDLIDVMRGATIDTSQALRGKRLRAALVVIEVALSVVLLAGAGLLVRSYVNLQRIDLGFRADNLIYAQVTLPQKQYRSAAAQQELFNEILARLQALPGVASATVVSAVPLNGGIRSGIDIAGAPHERIAPTIVQLATASYFRTTGLHLTRGRFFSDDEAAARRQIVVVNETLVKRYFGAADPLGQFITINALGAAPEDALQDPRFEVVGVVADTKNHGIRDAAWPEAFAPSSVTSAYGHAIVVRSVNARGQIINSVREGIWAIDRNVVIAETGMVEDLLRRYAYAEPLFSLAVLSAFAAVGLVLVMLGVYGAIAYAVARETHAIGIRMALGARPQEVRDMVLKRTLVLIAAGITIGMLSALFGTRALATQLWGVTPNDPVTLGAVAALILCVGLAAGYVPARRATRIDPALAMRVE